MSWTTSLPHLQQSPTLVMLRVLARMRNQSTRSAGLDGTLPYAWHQVMQRIMKYCPCIKKLMFYYERKSNVLISSIVCVCACVCVCVCVMLVTQSCPTLATQWIVTHQTSLSMEISRQEYWNGLPFPSPGIELQFPALRGNSLPK